MTAAMMLRSAGTIAANNRCRESAASAWRFGGVLASRTWFAAGSSSEFETLQGKVHPSIRKRRDLHEHLAASSEDDPSRIGGRSDRDRRVAFALSHGHRFGDRGGPDQRFQAERGMHPRLPSAAGAGVAQ